MAKADPREFVSLDIQGPYVGSKGAVNQGQPAFYHATGEASFTYGGIGGFQETPPPRTQARAQYKAVLGRKKVDANGF